MRRVKCCDGNDDFNCGAHVARSQVPVTSVPNPSNLVRLGPGGERQRRAIQQRRRRGPRTNVKRLPEIPFPRRKGRHKPERQALHSSAEDPLRQLRVGAEHLLFWLRRYGWHRPSRTRRRAGTLALVLRFLVGDSRASGATLAARSPPPEWKFPPPPPISAPLDLVLLDLYAANWGVNGDPNCRCSGLVWGSWTRRT